METLKGKKFSSAAERRETKVKDVQPCRWKTLLLLVGLFGTVGVTYAAGQTSTDTATATSDADAATSASSSVTVRGAATLDRRALSPQHDIIGDVNDNGLFAIDDVRRLRESVINNKRLIKSRSTSDRFSLADVAEPCGLLDERDADRLVAALQISASGYEMESRCHQGIIGQPLEAPPPSQVPENLDQRFSNVAERIEAFAGIFVQDGKLILALTKVDEDTVRDAQRALIGEFGKSLPETTGLEHRLVDYSFNQLHAYRKRARNLFATGDISSIDTDEVRNRVSIGLPDMSRADEVKAEIEALNIPLDAVHLFERKPFNVNNHVLLPRLQGTVSSLTAGVEVGIPLPNNMVGACSLGFLAERSGTRGFVTNTHCTRTNGATGVVFNQPASGNMVGTETIDPPVFTGGSCPGGESCRFSDAAFISLLPTANGRFGAMAKSVHVFPYTGSYTLTSKGPAFCGQTVHTVGRSSGESWGEVDESCCDLQADWSTVANTPNVVTLLCQDIYDNDKVTNGDSGAPVIVRDGYYDAKLVGVHWGSLDDTGAYSPISNIESELGSLWLTPHNIKPEVTITAPPDPTSLGTGLFHSITASADWFDFENSNGCNNCEIKWLSTKDGVVGLSSPVTGGSATATLEMYGQGIRYLVAVAKDGNGATSTDYIKLKTENADPNVWITAPQSNQVLYRGWDFVLNGDSFDAELFHALPCSSLSWSLSTGGSLSATNGCSVQGNFSTNGTKTITLSGLDTNGASDSSNVTVTVVDPPSSGPPQASWIYPNDQGYLPPDQLATLIAKANDPDGQSPITYEWWVRGSVLAGNVTAIKLGESTGNDGQQAQFQWKPGDDVPHDCGGNQVQLEVIAIDADGQSDNALIDVSVMYGPC